MTYVLDASVLLAIIGDEAGGDLAIELSRGGAMSWLNAGEVFSKIVDRGGRLLDALVLMEELGVTLQAFEGADAEGVANLITLTRPLGLSLGDRACLALARRLGRPVLTAERRWTQLDAGIEIRLLR